MIDEPAAVIDAPILIVDDHEANLLALEVVLSPLGHTLVRAASGKAALRQVLEHDFAVILLDVSMPDLDGFETAALIRGRARSSATPIVFISARSKEPTDVLMGYARGAVDYLVKPFDPDILRAKVEVFVELHRNRIEIQRQAAALREREQERDRLERSIWQIVESISDPLVILDEEWRISYLNAGATALLAHAGDQLVGRDLWSVVGQTAGATFYDQAHRARRDGVATSFDEYFPARGAWFEVKAYPTRDGRLSVQYRSIDARKQVEAVLARDVRANALRADIAAALANAERLSDTLRASAEAVVRHLDAAFARIWTLAPDASVLELQASAGIYTHLDGGHSKVPVGSFKIGRIAQNRTPHLTNDVAGDPEIGDPAWASAHGLVAFAGYPLVVDGACTGVVAMFARAPLASDTLDALAAVTDVIAQGIERRRAEDALEQRAQELARSNEELERFAYVASHDLQEPLRMVASYTQLLGRRYKGKLDANADEFIAFAVDGANRMQALINDLLAFSRVTTQAKTPALISLELPLASALANLQAAITTSEATILHDPLPALRVDQHQFVQLFQNLIGNALKFHGDAAPIVQIRCRAEGPDWVISIRDNGIGISSEFFERLFVLFQRLHTRTEYPGNGIGLAICKKIIERHGGRIWVESEPGHGTTFFFQLRGTE